MDLKQEEGNLQPGALVIDSCLFTPCTTTSPVLGLRSTSLPKTDVMDFPSFRANSVYVTKNFKKNSKWGWRDGWLAQWVKQTTFALVDQVWFTAP